MKRGTISIYENAVRLELVEGTVWLTQSEIARLLDVFVQTVSANLRVIFKSKELFEHEVTRCINGVVYYNLDIIIALAFRMKGGRCRLFREFVRESIQERAQEQFKPPIFENHAPPLIIQLNTATLLS